MHNDGVGGPQDNNVCSKVVRLMDRRNGAKKVTKIRPSKAPKDRYVMVRLDEEQKARIEQLAADEEQSMSGFVRSVILRMSKGWKLMPPS